MTRAVHLVGALPGNSPEEALELAYSTVGQHLRTVPDGETGERRKWVIAIFDMMREHPDTVSAKDFGGTYDPAVDTGEADPAEAEGKNWSDFDHIPRLKLRKWWRRPDPSFITTGIVDSYRNGYPVFRKFREANATSGQRFQIGFPGDFDMAVCSFGPQTIIAKSSFRDAIVRDITSVAQQAGDDVVFQAEIPWQVLPVSMVPRFLRGLAARHFARGLRKLAQQCPQGTRFGVHLCLGDMHHRSVVRLTDVDPLVKLVNRIVKHWPRGRTLEFIHLPFAHGEEPPTDEPAFYEPLKAMRVPSHVDIAVGFVHELREEGEQRALLGRLERLIGRTVTVGNSCGLGRQELHAAKSNLAQAAALTKDSTG